MDDIEAVVRLAKPGDLAFIQGKSHFDDKTVLRRIGDQEIFLLTVGDSPVGYLSIEFLWSAVPFINMLWIDEAYRKRGYSRALLGFVEDHLRQREHHILYSSSQANEAEPQAWHRYMGFVECGMINGINEGGIGEIFFRKPL